VANALRAGERVIVTTAAPPEQRAAFMVPVGVWPDRVDCHPPVPQKHPRERA
jgi:hypothetical protein